MIHMKSKRSWIKEYGKDELSIESDGKVTTAATTPGNPLETSTVQNSYEGTTREGLRIFGTKIRERGGLSGNLYLGDASM